MASGFTRKLVHWTPATYCISITVTLVLRMHVTRYTHEPQHAKTIQERREYCNNKGHNLDIGITAVTARFIYRKSENIKENVYLKK